MTQTYVQAPVPFTTGGADAPNVAATLPLPTSPGNRVVIAVTSNATLQTPSGFGVDRSQVNNNAEYRFGKATGAGGETSWTIAPTSGNAAIAGFVMEVAGLTASPVDQVISAGSGTNSSTRSTGTTPTTTQAAEWLLASCAWSRGSGAVNSINDGSWTNGFTDVVKAGGGVAEVATSKGSGTNVGIALAERTVSSTGTFETTATLAASSPGTAILVTYKISAADQPANINPDASATIVGSVTPGPGDVSGAIAHDASALAGTIS